MKRTASGNMVRDIAGLIGSRFMLVVFGFGAGIITARVLGPHDRGLFTLLITLPQTLVTFAKMGVAQANVYYVRRANVPVSTVASNSLVLTFVVSLAVLAACSVAGHWIIDPFVDGAPWSYVWLALVLVPFLLIESYFMAILQAVEAFGAYNLQSIIKAVLSFVGIATALLLAHGKLWEALVSQVSVLATCNLWLLIQCYRVAPFGLRWNQRVGRGTLSFGAKSYAQTLAAHLHYRIDLYLIALLLTPEQVAFYSIAVNMTNPILQIPDAIGTVIFPKLAGSSDQAAHERTAVTCRHTLFATLVAAVFYAGVGSQLMVLFYGSRYAPAIAPMFMMLPGIIMISMYQILSRNFTSRNRQQINIVAAGVALAVNAGANLLLIPRLGIVGAALSTAISYSLAAGILLAVFVRESGRRVRDTVLVGTGDLARYGQLLMATGTRLRRSGTP
ncbi:MAG: flippase [Deltaproteobacteria bacterium]|nr:flippase [Deltaproteobacteria bacterium]